MGSIDKSIRIILAIVIGVLYFTNLISGTIALVLSILAVVFIATSLISFCPLYVPFQINTYKNKK